MKSFKEFLIEGGTKGVPVISTDKQHVDLRETNTVNELNRALTQVTGAGFINPYSALERVRKIVVEYGLSIPQVGFLNEPGGNLVFEMCQFGKPYGYAKSMNGDIEKNGEEIPYKLHFKYELHQEGYYTASAVLVSTETTYPVSQ